MKKILNFATSHREKDSNDTLLLAIGAMLSKQQLSIKSENINDYEFKIFSQFGDDGIIQFIVKNIFIQNEVFIEFGVENYLESNTRFLLQNNNWQGFVMDGSEIAIDELKKTTWYWKYDLDSLAVFIDKDNINNLLKNTGFQNIGLLHIDLDGNDYHIFQQIDLSILNPSIVILEYNIVFGNTRFITVPYDKDFHRTKYHYSNLFWGASLPALNFLAIEKGYNLVGCNLAGNNAYFVRKDLLNNKVKELKLEFAFKSSKYRESRNRDSSLSYLRGTERIKAIKGLNVLNVITNEMEVF